MRGLPAYNKIIIGYSRPKGVRPLALLARLFKHRGYNDMYIQLHEPVSNEKVIFLLGKRLFSFYYAHEFFAHNKAVKQKEAPVSSVKFYEIWHYCIKRMGSDLTLRQRIWSKAPSKANLNSELKAKMGLKYETFFE